ncbi:uncharacterized protein LOC128643554, partial [Bombina bombina]|uniref:uncharacterized protein LOC128643554 n=1 Tax=Bombina bombina TaxID=8345 RepID=UPI00235A4ECC
ASEIEKRDMTARRRSPSPLNISKRPPSPTTENKRTQKVRSPSPSLSKTRLSSPSATQKPVPIQRPPLTANVLNVTKKNAGSELQPKEKAEECVSSESKSSPVSEKETPSVATKTKEGPRKQPAEEFPRGLSPVDPTAASQVSADADLPVQQPMNANKVASECCENSSTNLAV